MLLSVSKHLETQDVYIQNVLPTFQHLNEVRDDIWVLENFNFETQNRGQPIQYYDIYSRWD